MVSLGSEHPSFYTIQTGTGWGRVLASFADWCAPTRGAYALDIGCGPGLLPSLLEERGAQAFGVDLDPQALAHPLHSRLIRAEGLRLPFPNAVFHLVTTSNLLFLLPDPYALLEEMRRVLHPGGQVCLLNPSEHLTVQAAQALAEERSLQGDALRSLLGWARRAESSYRWDETETRILLSSAGLRLEESLLKMGPGFARFSRASFE